MATRSVSHYLALERGLAESLRMQDRDSARKMLAEDFELRRASEADVVTADDWLRSEPGKAASEILVRDLGVREIGDLAVVAFVRESRPAKGGARKKSVFVVDVWTRNPDRLQARFESPGPALTGPPPRPDGRE